MRCRHGRCFFRQRDMPHAPAAAGYVFRYAALDAAERRFALFLRRLSPPPLIIIFIIRFHHWLSFAQSAASPRSFLSPTLFLLPSLHYVISATPRLSFSDIVSSSTIRLHAFPLAARHCRFSSLQPILLFVCAALSAALRRAPRCLLYARGGVCATLYAHRTIRCQYGRCALRHLRARCRRARCCARRAALMRLRAFSDADD